MDLLIPPLNKKSPLAITAKGRYQRGSTFVYQCFTATDLRKSSNNDCCYNGHSRSFLLDSEKRLQDVVHKSLLLFFSMSVSLSCLLLYTQTEKKSNTFFQFFDRKIHFHKIRDE